MISSAGRRGTMARNLTLIAIFFTIFMLSSCAGSSQDNILVPPSPPVPFPVELGAEFKPFTVDGRDAHSEIILVVRTNEDLPSPVQLHYQISRILESGRETILQKNVMNEKMDTGTKREWDEPVTLTQYGKYHTLIQAEYGGWGQERSFVIEFYGDRVTIEKFK
jgi:hypothetical protein